MLDDRNKTSHLYRQKDSNSIFNRIKEKYVEAIEKLLKSISDYEQPER